MGTDFMGVLKFAADRFPYPIAGACRRYIDDPGKDDWAQWERLTRDVFQVILQYLSHLMLSDLVATGRKPASLYHRIQSVLSRPMAGHYAGFLRESARFYMENGIRSAVPDLVAFIYSSEVEDPEPLLGKLVDYRNLYAHGRIEDTHVVKDITDKVKELMGRALEGLRFLENYRLELEDGTPAMGSDPRNLAGKIQAVRTIVPEGNGFVMRPLLLKLSGPDLVLLEDHDLSDLRLTYRGSRTYQRFGKKELKSGDGRKLLEDMRELLTRVRSEEAVLPHPDWESFLERSKVMTQRTLSLYEDMHKYVPKWYVPHHEWEGPDGIFSAFLRSERTMMALNGAQGSGKSALVSHLAAEASKAGHAVLLVNAQRFTFSEVTWAGNPYAGYFASQLHYEKPLDREALRRLTDEAPEGRQVIFMIDAVNEVDGLTTKWNRFRAMEELLEWIAAVAQPKLKFVVSFRLDVYEEYEYLQDDELPPSLGEITFPGDNPRKPWVLDIKPFDLKQAERLYMRLQELPELGMAPAMSWKDLKDALGESLLDFTSNPLIFTVLLKSHHQLAHIGVKDRDSLFQAYSRRLTGSGESEKWPWWKRLLGFVKNGNVTPKERFLVDVVEKMAEEGSAAFMAQRLKPKQKRDRRLIEAINSPSVTTLKDLKEGGLIVEEKIEVRKGDQEILHRRFSYVAEMMATAFDAVEDKIRKFTRFKNAIQRILTFLAVSFISYGLVALLVNETSDYLSGTGVNQEAISAFKGLTFSGAFWNLLFPVCIAIIFLYFVLDFLNIPLRARDVGLTAKGFYRYLNENSKRPILLTGFCSLVVAAGALIFLFLSGLQRSNTSTAIGFLVISIIPLLLAFVHPVFGIYLLEHNVIMNPVRLTKKASQAIVLFLELKATKRRRFLKFAFAILVCLFMSVAFLFSPFSVDPIHHSNFQPFMGAVPYMGSVVVKAISDYSIPLMRTIKKTMQYATFPICFAFLLFKLHSSLYEKNIYKLLARRPTLKKRRFLIAKLSGVYSILLIIFFSGAFFRHSHIAERKERVYMETRSILLQAALPEDKYELNADGEIIRLDLLDASGEQINLLMRLDLTSLEALIMPKSCLAKFNVKAYPNLSYLEAPGDSIASEIHLKMNFFEPFELIVYDPKDFLARVNGSTRICVLGLIGTTQHLSRVPSLFPNLRTLIIDEEAARSGITELPDLGPNLLLTIRSEAPPLLDWLNETHARCVINLSHPFDINSLNTDMIRRLLMDADELDPNALVGAERLEWLLLRFKRPPQQSLLADLHTVLGKHLPSLRILEFASFSNSGHIQIDLATVLSANGKPEMMTLLDRLVQDPDMISKRVISTPGD